VSADGPYEPRRETANVEGPAPAGGALVWTTSFRGFLPLLQINQVVLLENGPRLLIDNPETQLTAVLRRTLHDERAEMDLRGVVSLGRGGWFFFPRLSYLLWDRLRFRIGYLVIGGPADSFIGQFRRNDEVVLQARFSF
jgi:hypothetical protein